MLKHVETKKRHRERERRQERKGKEGADERKARILRKLEAKKKKKERQERRSHRERKGSHRKGAIGGECARKTKDERKRAARTERATIKKGEKTYFKSEGSSQTPSCGLLSKSTDPAILESRSEAAFYDTSLCIPKYTKHEEEEQLNCDSDSSHTSGFISPPTPPQSKDMANNVTSESDKTLPSSYPTCPNTSSFKSQDKQLHREDHASDPPASREQELPMLDHSECFEEVSQPEEKSQHAPDLLPAHSNSIEDHLRLDPSASPPVLSWQGSPVSDLSEEEEDEAGSNIAGVIRRPVLQPSPTHSSPVQNPEEIWKELGHPSDIDYCHSDLAKLYGIAEPLDEVEEEEDKEPVAEHQDSSTTTSQGAHLQDTDGTLVSDSHKYASRGGPFCRSPPNTVTGVKYSSSLSLGPDIHPPEHQSPTFLSPRAVSPVPMPLTSLSSSISTSDPPNTDKNMPAAREEKEEGVVQEEHDDTETVVEHSKDLICTSLVKENEVKVSPSTMSPATLQAKLVHSCEMLLNQSSSTLLLSDVSSGKEKVKSRLEKKKQRHDRDRRREQQKNQKETSGGSGSTGGPGFREEKMQHKKHKRNTKREKQHCSSRAEPKHLTKVHSKRAVAERKPTETERGQRKGNKVRGKAKEGNNDKRTKNTFSSGRGSAAPPAVRVLSAVPLRELKVQLVKLRISAKQTYTASDFEQKRIPLKEISINNSAAEIIRACK